MRGLLTVIASVAALAAAPAVAQTGPQVAEAPTAPPPRSGLDNSTQGQVDALVAAPGGVQFSAEEGGARVTLRAGKTRPYVETFNDGERSAHFDTWSAAVSAPLGEGDSSAKFGSLEGLAGATTVEFKFSRTVAKFTPRGNAAARASAMLAICDNVEKPDSEEDAECDFDFVVRNAPDQAEEFSRIMWGDNLTSFTWGGSAKAGSEKFEYVDPTTLARLSTEETSWSATGFVAYYWSSIGKDESLVSASYTRESSWQNPKDATICPPGGPPTSCVIGPPGPPAKTDKDIFSLAYRRSMGDMAFSLTANYDSQSEVFGIELPIYLVRGDDGGFTGGVKFDWRSDTDEVVAGIFVSQPFSLLEF